MAKTIPFKFSLLPGDLINCLAGIKTVCEAMNHPAHIYLGLNIEWGTTELTGRGRENKVSLTERTMEMLKPLLLSQPYISCVDSYEEIFPDKYKAWVTAFKSDGSYDHAGRWYSQHEDGIIDLDKVNLFPINAPYGNIFRWPFYIYPDMACDLSKQWISVEPQEEFKSWIVINRTLRSQNETISYKFLREYRSQLLFVGLQEEYDAFQLHSNIYTLPFLKAKDFLELATIIRSCSFFIGNQSLCFSLAEAMKVPRILETCSYLPNVIPCGPDGYDFYFQKNLEFYVEKLVNLMAKT